MNEVRLRVLAALLVLTAGAARAAVPAEQCGLCHPDARVAFATSIHGAESMGCTSCHGGDPASLDVAAAHRAGFQALGDRRQIPTACAACHADLERMRPYNLAVDQYALYQTSQHGKALAAGDRRVAVCSDCHGAHDVRRPDDPVSPVNRRNIAATCARCHGDAELMKSYELDPRIPADYESSVHGEQMQQGNRGAPTCVDCHGVHGATPPQVGDVDKVCGACHEAARRAFLAGPHYRGMLDAGLPECSSCHGDHKLKTLSVTSLDEVCSDCHGTGSDQELLGRRLGTLISTATAAVESGEELAARARRIPLDVEDQEARLEEGRTYLTQALPLVHSVSEESLEEVTRRALSVGEGVQHEIYAQLDPTDRRILLSIFWFYVVMTVVILVNYKRRLRQAGGEG